MKSSRLYPNERELFRKKPGEAVVVRIPCKCLYRDEEDLFRRQPGEAIIVRLPPQPDREEVDTTEPLTVPILGATRSEAERSRRPSSDEASSPASEEEVPELPVTPSGSTSPSTVSDLWPGTYVPSAETYEYTTFRFIFRELKRRQIDGHYVLDLDAEHGNPDKLVSFIHTPFDNSNPSRYLQYIHWREREASRRRDITEATKMEYSRRRAQAQLQIRTNFKLAKRGERTTSPPMYSAVLEQEMAREDGWQTFLFLALPFAVEMDDQDDDDEGTAARANVLAERRMSETSQDRE